MLSEDVALSAHEACCVRDDGLPSNRMDMSRLRILPRVTGLLPGELSPPLATAERLTHHRCQETY